MNSPNPEVRVLDLDLAGRVVLVTGGTRGIGRGIAEAFLAAGCEVATCGRHAPDPPVAAGDATATWHEADVRDPEQAAGLVDAVVAAAGRLDVVVNNAGGAPPADAATASPRFSARVVDLNLLAPLYVAQRANAVMQAQPNGGAIVNIGSVAAARPSPTVAVYAAAKAGLLALTRSLAAEWAPKVRVNYVSVGLVETELAHLHYGDERSRAAVSATVPMRRMASPADVAAACLYLASPLAAYVTGADLAVHGGGEPPPFLLASRDISDAVKD